MTKGEGKALVWSLIANVFALMIYAFVLVTGRMERESHENLLKYRQSAFDRIMNQPSHWTKTPLLYGIDGVMFYAEFPTQELVDRADWVFDGLRFRRKLHGKEAGLLRLSQKAGADFRIGGNYSRGNSCRLWAEDRPNANGK